MGELTDRIDAERDDLSPPHRRFRLVLDLNADTLNGLCQALSNVGLDVWDLYHRETTPAMRLTHGGVADGWHVEVLDRGETVTAEVYREALRDYIDRLRGGTDGE